MAKGERIRLLVVRCGSTEWDEAGRMQGAADLPLCEAGRQSTEAIAGDIAVDPPQVVLSGPDEASRTAAKVLAQAAGAKVKTLDELSEIHLGLWEGLLESGVEERYPRAAKQWAEDPGGVSPPEGESLQHAKERILTALADGIDRLKEGAAAAVVLRPVALGIVRCWLNDAPTAELWSQIRDRPAAEWYDVSAERLRKLAAPA
jgi:broad specificity phosphatase PhoE